MGGKSKQTFLQRYLDMANKQAKMLNITIRENQIKTTMTYHFILVRIAIIKKSTNSKCWRGCGEKGILINPADEWINKIVVYKYSGIVFSFKKKRNSDIFYKWMDLEDTILCEISHSQRQILQDSTYMGSQSNHIQRKIEQNSGHQAWREEIWVKSFSFIR